MANRVTDTEVKEILSTDLTTTPFIDTANIIVTDLLAGEGLSDAKLAQIELYLSAHFVCMNDPRIRNEEAGDALAAYQMIKVGTGLDSTSYGQTAMMLDTTGKLKEMGKRTVIFKAMPEE